MCWLVLRKKTQTNWDGKNYSSVNELKADENLFETFNRTPRSMEVALTRLNPNCVAKNAFAYKPREFLLTNVLEIQWSNSRCRTSNIGDLFRLIGVLSNPSWVKSPYFCHFNRVRCSIFSPNQGIDGPLFGVFRRARDEKVHFLLFLCHNVRTCGGFTSRLYTP